MVGVTVIFVVVIYALLVRMAVRFFTSDIEPKSRGRTLQVYSYIAFGILPFIDVIVGNARLSVLCMVEARDDVHKDIFLPKRFFDHQGRPYFLSGRSELIDWDKLRDVITYDSTIKEYAFPKIKKSHVVIRSTGGELLAESIWFTYRGSWIGSVTGSIGPGNNSCWDVVRFDALVRSRIFPLDDGV